MKRKFRVGISGVSGIAQMVHLPILRRMSNVEVTAIFDNDFQRARRIAEKFKIKKVYKDFQDFIQSNKFDVLDICSPVHFHFAEASAAIKSGLHVLIEKPFVENAKEARELIKLADKADSKIMSLMNLKFRPDAIALKSIIQAGQIGEVFFIKTGWLRRNEKWQQKNVFLKNQQGVLMHLGIQLIDLSLWLLGESKVKTVKANGFKNIMGSWVEDTAFLLLNLENDTAVAIEIGWKMNYGKDFLYANLFGNRGAAKLNPFTILIEKNGKLFEKTANENFFHGEAFQKSYENEFAHFFFCLENEKTMQSCGSELVERMKILDAAYESIRTGKEVELR